MSFLAAGHGSENAFACQPFVKSFRHLILPTETFELETDLGTDFDFFYSIVTNRILLNFIQNDSKRNEFQGSPKTFQRIFKYR